MATTIPCKTSASATTNSSASSNNWALPNSATRKPVETSSQPSSRPSATWLSSLAKRSATSACFSSPMAWEPLASTIPQSSTWPPSWSIGTSNSMSSPSTLWKAMSWKKTRSKHKSDMGNKSKMPDSSWTSRHKLPTTCRSSPMNWPSNSTRGSGRETSTPWLFSGENSRLRPN
jgi:hypothetical protein